MSLMTEVTAAADAAKERLGTAFEQLERSARKGRFAIVRAQHAAEDGASGLALQVRRYPLRAVAVAVAAGALAGALMGIAVTLGVCRRQSSQE